MNLQHYCQPMVALIPARAGSKRVPGKNIRLLNGVPLIGYTISAALDSGVFARVVVCSDDERVFIYTSTSGREWPVDYVSRAPVSDTQPDIEWIRDALRVVWLADERQTRSFAILRPTSPFRTAETIRRAYEKFTLPDQTADSIRAVEPAKQSPYKMWTLEHDFYPLKPLLPGAHPDGTPYHSSPTQSCPPVWVQNSSLEMAWTANVESHGTIAGRKIAPFFTREFEGFSIDTEADWRDAEYLARTRPDLLPPVDVARLSPAPAG